MQRYFEALLDMDTGATLVGYYAQLIDPVSLAVVPMYADLNGTPIEQITGIPNMAQSGDAGNLSFFYPDGFYNLNIYAPDAETLVKRFRFIGSEIRNASGLYTPTLTGGSTPGVTTGTVRGSATLNGSLASVVINATWTAHTGLGQLTLSLPSSIGGVGITPDPSGPPIVPCEVDAEGFVISAGRILTGAVNLNFNRLRLWERSVGDGVNALTRTPFILPSAGSVYVTARYPVLRT